MPGTDDSVERLRKDHTNLAASLTAIVTEVGSIKTDKAIERAVAVEREKALVERQANLNERLDRIEESLKGLYGLGKWVLLTFFACLIAAVATFIFKGGLHVPSIP